MKPHPESDNSTGTDAPSGAPRDQYQVERDAPADVIYQRVTQACAMAHVIVGDGFDSFKRYNDDVQHEFLWALSAMLDDAVVALGHQTRAKVHT